MESNDLFPSNRISFDIKQFLSVFQYWSWLILTISVLMGIGGYLVSRSMKPVYKASTVILVRGISSTGIINYDSVVTGEKLAMTYAQIMTSGEFLHDVLSRLDKSSITFDQLMKAISITPIRNTQLIEVSIQYEDPIIAAQLANTTADVFIEQINKDSANSTISSREILKANIDQLNQQITEIQAEIKQRYQSNHDQKLKTVQDAITALYLEIRQLNNEIIRLQYDTPIIKSTDDNQIIVYATATPSIVNLNSLAEKTLQLEEKKNLLSKYQDEYVLLNTNQDITTNTDPEITQAQSVLNQLQMIYLTSLKDYETNQFNNTQSPTGVIQIYKSEAPQKPIRPSIKINTALGFMIGLLLSTIGVYGFELFDPHVKDPNFFFQKYGLPILAVQKKSNEHETLIIKHIQSYPEIYETCRLLQMGIVEKGEKNPVLMTSPTFWDEGDSLSAYLAVMIAQSGSKTLLVDASMNDSKIPRLFELNRPKRLDVLHAGSIETVNDVESSTEFTNLSVICLDGQSPNQLSILNEKKAQDALNELKERYEYVIIYAPHVAFSVDAFLLASLIKSAILVIKPERSTIPDIDQAVQKLKSVEVSTIGVVLNNISSKRYKYYYKNFTHYYPNPKSKEKIRFKKINPFEIFRKFFQDREKPLA